MTCNEVNECALNTDIDADLSVVDRDAIAEYLAWLRTATPADLDRLGPP